MLGARFPHYPTPVKLWIEEAHGLRLTGVPYGAAQRIPALPGVPGQGVRLQPLRRMLPVRTPRPLPAIYGFLCHLLVLGSWSHGTLCMLTTLGFVRRSRRHATDEKHHHRSHRFQLRWRYSQPDDVQKLAQEYADMPVD